MRLQILHVQGCPNTGVLLTRLEQSLAGRVAVELRVVRDQAEAAAAGMTGSPTLLVDGVDPFAGPDRSPSLSCRLYVDETGVVCGTPSVTQLRVALTRAR